MAVLKIIDGREVLVEGDGSRATRVTDRATGQAFDQGQLDLFNQNTFANNSALERQSQPSTTQRAPIQRNTVLGASSGASQEEIFQSRADATRDTRISAQLGGNIFNSRSGGLDGDRSGQDKLQKLNDAGLQDPSRRSATGVNEINTDTFGVPLTAADVNHRRFDTRSDNFTQGEGEDPKDFQIRKLNARQTELNGALNESIIQNDIVRLGELLKEEQEIGLQVNDSDLLAGRKQFQQVELEAQNKELQDKLDLERDKMEAKINAETTQAVNDEFNRLKGTIGSQNEALREESERILREQIQKRHDKDRDDRLESLSEGYDEATKNYSDQLSAAIKKVEQQSANPETLAQKIEREKKAYVASEQSKNPHLTAKYLSSKFDQLNKYDAKGEEQKAFGELVDSVLEGPEDAATKFGRVVSDTGDIDEAYKALKSRVGEFAAKSYKEQYLMQNGWGEARIAQNKMKTKISDLYLGEQGDPMQVGVLLDNLTSSGVSDEFIEGQLSALAFSPNASESVKSEARALLADQVAKAPVPDLEKRVKAGIATPQEEARFLQQTRKIANAEQLSGFITTDDFGVPDPQSSGVNQQKNSLLSRIRAGQLTKTEIPDIEQLALSQGWVGDFQQAVEDGKPISEKEATAFSVPSTTTKGELDRVVAIRERDGLGNRRFQSLDAKEYSKLDGFIQLKGRLEEIQSLYREFKKAGGDLRDGGDKLKRTLGRIGESTLGLNPNKNLRLHRKIGALTGENLALFIKEISGAAVSEQEAQRLAQLKPSVSMADTQFEDQLERMMSEYTKTAELKLSRYGFQDFDGLEDALSSGFESVDVNAGRSQRPPSNETGLKDEIVNEIVGSEGFRPNAYQDIGGVWTVGHGFTTVNGRPVRSDDVMSEEQSLQLLDQKFGQYQTYKDKITVPLTSAQEAALTSFSFNLGAGIFDKHPQIIDLINAQDFQGAANLIKKFNKFRSNGELQFSQGLQNRRNREAGAFLNNQA